MLGTGDLDGFRCHSSLVFENLRKALRPPNNSVPTACVCTEDAMRSLEEILQQPGLTNAQRHACRASFLRRLHAALPAPYYEVVHMCSETSRDQGDWWHPEPRFHATCSVCNFQEEITETLGTSQFIYICGCIANVWFHQWQN